MVSLVAAAVARRDARWRAVAGETYAAWIVEQLDPFVRRVVLSFVIGAPVSVALLLAPLAFPELHRTLTWWWLATWLALAIAGVAYSFFSSRALNALPRRIADDLWSRGFAVVGLPPVRSQGQLDFLKWVSANSATPSQLGAAALAPIVQDAPRRTAGPLPASMVWSRLLGVVGAIALVVSVFWQYSLGVPLESHDVLAAGYTPWRLSLGERAWVYLGAVLALWAAVQLIFVWFASAGVARTRLIVSWQAPIFLTVVAINAVAAPNFAWLNLIAITATVAFVALLWLPASSAFVADTTALNRAIVDAATRRATASAPTE